ncbi:hypothetical protein TNCT_525881 [Trichonephila clavata]|uniref:Uncharacterized protein n=1 Tax=Trichonephila clavata TaxID=2740835 RepID=A0A8X6HQ14_TRICU|nr:hypothetical protein TNCT_525881 [Trichonephila clavata]
MRNVQSDKVLYSEYCKGLKNYLDEGITDEATNPFISANNPVFCLPRQVMIKSESLATKLRIVFDASAHKRTVFEMEMRLKTERCKIMQEQKQFKGERAKMLSVDPDAVAQPVAIGEEKCLSRDSFNVPPISADEEMYEEKEVLNKVYACIFVYLTYIWRCSTRVKRVVSLLDQDLNNSTSLVKDSF